MEGGTAAEIRGRKVTYAVIKRLTSTQIVLDNDRRYQRTRLREIGANAMGVLFDPSDRAVLNKYAQQQYLKVTLHADRVVFSSSAILSKLDLAGVCKELDTLAALIQEAREEIDRRANP